MKLMPANVVRFANDQVGLLRQMHAQEISAMRSLAVFGEEKFGYGGRLRMQTWPPGLDADAEGG